MLFEEFFALLSKAFTMNCLTVPTETQAKRFYDFAIHLLKTNEQMNLTAIRDLPSVITKHFADSSLASAHIPQNATVLDIGCGAGFPTIPLAIIRPDLCITALDSTDKKVQFVAASAKMLGLTNVKTASGRAEDKELQKQLGTFDTVVSRAVSRLPMLSELAAAYVKIGGRLLALKGADGLVELEEAKNALRVLGFTTKSAVETHLTLLDGTEEARTLLSIQKDRPTPPAYPRPYAAIKKAPL